MLQYMSKGDHLFFSSPHSIHGWAIWVAWVGDIIMNVILGRTNLKWDLAPLICALPLLGGFIIRLVVGKKVGLEFCISVARGHYKDKGRGKKNPENFHPLLFYLMSHLLSVIYRACWGFLLACWLFPPTFYYEKI